MPLSLCHIKPLTPLCCLLWLAAQPQHLNIKLFNQHVIRKSTGRSRLAHCKLSCWHMLIPNGLTADFAYTAFVCLSVSVHALRFVCVCSWQLVL